MPNLWLCNLILKVPSGACPNLPGLSGPSPSADLPDSPKQGPNSMWLAGRGPPLNYHNLLLLFSPLVSALNNENTEIESFPCLALMKCQPLHSDPPPTHRGFIIKYYYTSILFPLSSHFPVSISSCLGPESLSPPQVTFGTR